MWKNLLLCLTLPLVSVPMRQSVDRLHLVESAPVGTAISSPDLPSFHKTWMMFAESAKHSIELAHFYASNEQNSQLENVVLALEQAAKRGVKVRFLVDERFYKTYPETLDRLGKSANVQIRRLDLKVRTGGVLHAKYMRADSEHVCVGSANFDWRALEHIQELGAVVHNAAVGQALGDVFEMDWWLADGGEEASRPEPRVSASDFPVKLRLDAAELGTPITWEGPAEDNSDSWVKVTPVFSPKGLLPSDGLWDLPRILAWIEGARQELRIQVMTFRLTDRKGKTFELLEGALLRAAERGVQVKLLVADWGKRPGTIEGLQALAQKENVAVRMVTIPPAPKGHIPFARVIHSKYMVVDDEQVWLGSSNWEEGYFYQSRNAGFLLEGKACARRLIEYFEAGWKGPYSYEVDPQASYTPPRIGD